ncbi:chemotaxis protein CheA [Mariprofundus erugo]|uniref:chemotaxis protein CheA n=1 Tax=Mariprofundus erugo TaxID=2528639 RepID=UPI0010FE2FBB|nr:chemotaxis protein CheA [Mariprofundus erugo]TLS78214.1 chemotaxis protein CheA [Mariprofundus erugo]
MAVDLDQFKQIFFEESFEGLETMETGLLGMTDGETNLDIVNDIFRAAHSIKGGSATFGFTAVASFTHVMEGLLDEMREGKRQADQTVINILLESVDEIRTLMTAYQNREDPDTDQAQLLQQKLEAIFGGSGNTAAAPEKESANKSEAAEENRLLGWHIEFTPHDNLLITGNDPALLLSELAYLGKMTMVMEDGALPPFTEMNPEQCYLRWKIDLLGVNDEGTDAAQTEEAQIREIFEWVEDECDLVVKGIYPERKASDRRAGDRRQPGQLEDRRQSDRRIGPRRPDDKAPAAQPTTIRVDTNRIDALIDMVGELVITQSMLGQLGEDFDMSKLSRLKEGLEELERNSREIQDAVMKVRMQPISFAFNRFPRMVHDLSQKLGKKIRLELVGEDTEMDKTVMEKINDPLVHLVRNSLDHGLETPDKRIAKGKDEEGVVCLKAYHQGGSIVVEVSDDGNGLDRNKLFAKGVERGLIKETDVLTDEQIYMLLFAAGFSTAETLSDISGRGVGLDVVRRNIESLGGNVDVRSVLGEGTVFTIRLPLTLAVLDGQLLKVDGQTYVLPLNSIIESLQIDPNAISSLAGDAEVYQLRDAYIPMVSLSELFATGEEKPRGEKKHCALLVIVEWADKRIGLMVDDLLGQQQVVIKSLETNYERVPGLSGATILGDGTVSLILDISGIIEMSTRVREQAMNTRRATGKRNRVA